MPLVLCALGARLDRFTSGVMVVAKHAAAHAHLHAQFAAKTTERYAEVLSCFMRWESPESIRFASP